MATNTYTALATQTLGSASSSVTFSSIPSGYTDLVLVMSAKITSGGATNDRLQFNGDTGTNYSTTVLYGTGSSAGSYRLSNNSSILIDDVTSTNFNVNEINIQNYSNTTTYKTVVLRSSPSDSSVQANVGLWRSTAAITSLTILAGASTFVAGSTFNLYGIANADIGALATGGIITYDANYYYHTFGASGTFTPKQSLTVDYLVLAGGGGGYGSYLGAGGAGGYRTSVGTSGGGGSAESQLSLTATPYTVTVGAGGTSGGKGSDSVFSTITSIGGGGAAASPKDGGSGAGGGASSISPSAGSGTANQGYAGGSGALANSTSAGGGGAGGAGGNNASGGGTGGAGITSSISGTAVARGGGGGGGADAGFGPAGTASAGGGAGSINGTASSGTANTGGGGGSPYTGTGGNGGSGVVIVRYPR